MSNSTVLQGITTEPELITFIVRERSAFPGVLGIASLREVLSRVALLVEHGP